MSTRLPDSRPIGIFDSGIGGLTVVKAVIDVLPHESIIYFGDMARVPYGTKSKETVTHYAAQIIRFLHSCEVKMIVIACNTVSSNCVEELRANFPDMPIVEVVSPGVRMALAATTNKTIGVIGTQATVNSHKYRDLLLRADPELNVIEAACTLFVPIVEEGWADTKIAKDIATTYLKPLLKQKIDTLILGCTHYPLLTNTIAKVVGPGVKLIDPAEETAQETATLLAKYDLFADVGVMPCFESSCSKPLPRNVPRYTFCVSDSAERFGTSAGIFLGDPVRQVRVIPIENY